MTKPSILIQLDVDAKPSAFDAVAAIDSGVDRLLTYGDVAPGDVADIVRGAIFTRGLDDLKRTAIFIGGSDVARAEAVREAVRQTFFGPFRVSTLLDANGCNTTAASAVLATLEACELRNERVEETRIVVLGGTGPVGQRVARLLASLGAKVVVGSRKLERAKAIAEGIAARVGRTVESVETATEDQTTAALQGAPIAIATGALGATLLPESVRTALPPFLALIDLNAVPPLGIEAVAATDKRKELLDGTLAWGAIGVGGAKMKIHKKSIQELFTSNDKQLDAEEVLEIARRG